MPRGLCDPKTDDVFVDDITAAQMERNDYVPVLFEPWDTSVGAVL